MPKIIEDDYECKKDGKFHWKGYYFDRNGFDCIVGKWDDLKQNFIDARPLGNQLLITVKCPICKEKYTLYKEK